MRRRAIESSLPIVGGTSQEEDERALVAARSWRATRVAAGFGWISGPQTHGGLGLGAEYEQAFDLLEQQFDAPDPSYLRTGFSIVGPTIQRFGSDRLRDAVLPGLYRGDHVICQLFSEPNAGSDLASAQTKAVRGRRHLAGVGAEGLVVRRPSCDARGMPRTDIHRVEQSTPA